jgi:acyl-[acyl-carrier-protein]-phospholipid O-acyltransferase/long-chain-fatty-acid--[acyl-carrier-protein] ligase
MTDEKTDLPRSFAWLNYTQFLGALNDNLFKLLLVFLLVEVQGQEHRATILSLASAVFVLPFLLFSHAAGVLADRHSKRTIVVCAKVLEVVLMLFGCLAVWMRSPPMLYSTLFLLCTQAALFGPSKYGIIPELVGEERLSRANAVLCGSTYLAIIMGTFIPSFLLLKVFDKNFLLLALSCLGVAAAGLWTSFRIEKTAAQHGKSRFSLFFLRDQFRTLFGLRSDRDLLLAVLGSAYFLYLASFAQQALMLYGSDAQYLNLGWIESGYLFPVSAFGIGLGALLSGKLSGRNVEFGIVPLGALCLTLACVALWALPARLSAAVPAIFLLGVGSGLFIVPLDSFIQYRSPVARRGEILACANFLSFLGVALSAGTFYVMTQILHFDAGQCFLASALMTAGLALIAILALPDFFIRFVVVLITRSIYRIRSRGMENLPIEGGALLVSNHVTWVDALLITSIQQRRIRFVMAREIYERPLLRPLFKLMGVIPISPLDPPRKVVESMQRARAAMEDGYLVCVFPEGALTRNGNLREFRPGFEHMLRGTTFPVIPVCIGGAWGSIFSYYEGRMPGRHPRQVPYPVALVVGRPLPHTTRATEVRQAVQELSAEAAVMLKDARCTLPHGLLRTARRRWFRPAFSDSTGKRLSFGQALTAAVFLAEELDRRAPQELNIGILLPASIGGALANLAVSLTGRVPVNLNFTAPQKSMEEAARQCEMRTILTSKLFLKKMEGLQPPAPCVYLEDLMPAFTPARKLRAFLKAALLPARLLMTFRRPKPDDVATIIFSSGSTGAPKGSLLTHYNIYFDVMSFRSVFRFDISDRMCAVLPFFHSFGFTCTFWLPMLTGFAVAYHANPLDVATITELVRKERLTVLLATPTFLLTYMRRATPEDFASLRIVVTGAEKLKPRLADSFQEKYGPRPMEGYGATELSPVVSVNLPDVTLGGISQTGTKAGGIGHPIPGVAARVVDIDSGRPVPNGRDGMLQVKGPNVMLGYLNQPEKTAEVLHNGWYTTGDVGHMDDEGFLFITDRLSRYSKIGGEMVPHLAIEEKLLEALHAMHHVLFVTAVEDERKGEQLVVLYTSEAGSADDLHRIAGECDIPNLWKPRRDNFIPIAHLPTLGSGKLDLKRLREFAAEQVKNRTAGAA